MWILDLRVTLFCAGNLLRSSEQNSGDRDDPDAVTKV